MPKKTVFILKLFADNVQKTKVGLVMAGWPIQMLL